MRWCTVQTNEYDLQAKMYSNICANHKLHNDNENKFPVFPERICNKGQNIIRKSKDYVYGIWVYKALDIWKGYYRVKKSLVSYVKPWTEARNNKYMKYHSKLTYQLSFWNVSRKVDYHAGGKWFIHGPKRHKENQLLSLKHPCWLSLV